MVKDLIDGLTKAVQEDPSLGELEVYTSHLDGGSPDLTMAPGFQVGEIQVGPKWWKCAHRIAAVKCDEHRYLTVKRVLLLT